MARIAVSIFFFVIFNTSDLFAEVIDIQGKTIHMRLDTELKVSLSEDCLSAKVPCLAFQAFQKAKTLSLSSQDLSGGKNPGSVKCKILGGKVLIGLTKNRDELSMCLFKQKFPKNFLNEGRKKLDFISLLDLNFFPVGHRQWFQGTTA